MYCSMTPIWHLRPVLQWTGLVTCFETALRVDVERRAALDAEIPAKRSPTIGWSHGTNRYGRPSARAISGPKCSPGGGSPQRTAAWRPPAVFLFRQEELGLLDCNMMDSILRIAFKEAAPASPRHPRLPLHQRLTLAVRQRMDPEPTSCAVGRNPVSRAFAGGRDHRDSPDSQYRAYPWYPQGTRLHRACLLRSMISASATPTSRSSANCRSTSLELDRTLGSCDLETDSNAHALAERVLALASRLNIKATAEGVENRAPIRNPARQRLYDHAGLLDRASSSRYHPRSGNTPIRCAGVAHPALSVHKSASVRMSMVAWRVMMRWFLVSALARIESQ